MVQLRVALARIGLARIYTYTRVLSTFFHFWYGYSCLGARSSLFIDKYTRTSTLVLVYTYRLKKNLLGTFPIMQLSGDISRGVLYGNPEQAKPHRTNALSDTPYDRTRDSTRSSGVCISSMHTVCIAKGRTGPTSK